MKRENTILFNVKREMRHFIPVIRDSDPPFTTLKLGTFHNPWVHRNRGFFPGKSFEGLLLDHREILEFQNSF